MQVKFWLDPICPWCWMTSRWLIAVSPHRDLDIRWHSISLKLKNEYNSDHPFTGIYNTSHNLLRVLEAVRAPEGNQTVGDLYSEYGKRIHHGQDLEFDPAEALEAVGLDRGYGSAADNPSWDKIIAADMAEGLALTGDDVGTPLLGFDDIEGNPIGIFGPVISRTLDLDVALRLWDSIYGASTIPSFWELKRTRNESAEIGFRPPQ